MLSTRPSSECPRPELREAVQRPLFDEAGEPTRDRDCPMCGGSGIHVASLCPNCEGTGAAVIPF
jgi:DnaJ-class molecular chaperone